MLLYVNGCSHTYGTELSLEGDFKSAWPYLFAKNLDAKLINSSKRGASNLTIYKNTIEDILSLKQKPDLVIVQWTHSERYDSPMGKRDYKLQIVELGKKVSEIKNYKTHYPYEGVYKDPLNKDYYLNYFDEASHQQVQYMNEITFFYIYMLQSFLSAKKINFIFLSFNRNKIKTRIDNNNKIPADFYIDRLHRDNWLHSVNISLVDILRSYNYKLCKKLTKDGYQDDHWMKDSHEFLSEALLDFYHLKEKLVVSGNNLRNRQRDFLHFYGDDM